MFFWLALISGIIVAIRLYNRKVRSAVCKSERKLDGKTAIVTGASAGIGKATALEFARRGARVILACRNVEKAQKVADDIIATTGNKEVIVHKVDLSEMDSVRNFAKKIIDTESALHILVNNAGTGGAMEKTITSDGLEVTMAACHFGHFLLTNMLLDLLEKSGPSRVVNVASNYHAFCNEFDVDDLNFEKRPYPGPFPLYHQAKLCNMLFTLELAEKLRDTGVTANVLHPGLVQTEIFWKHKSYLAYLLGCFCFLVGKDEKLGAECSVHVAVSEELDDITGEYFCECRINERSELAKDRGLAKKLWEKSETLVKLTQEDLCYKKKEQKQNEEEKEEEKKEIAEALKEKEEEFETVNKEQAEEDNIEQQTEVVDSPRETLDGDKNEE